MFLEFSLRGVDRQKLQGALEPVARETKHNGGHTSLFEGDVYFKLKSYARLIQDTIALSDSSDVVEGLQNKYKWLNKLSAKILAENVDCFMELYDIPIGKVFMTHRIIEFGDIDYYNLRDLQDYIQNKPINGDAMLFVEECNKEYKASDLLLLQTWFALFMELFHIHEELDVIGHCPDEPIVTLKDIIGSQIDRGGVPLFSVNLPDKVLIAILNGLKEAKWRNNRVMDVGLVASDITDKEWLSLFRAASKDYPAATRKLPWKSVQACKTFVELLLANQFELAEKVFCWSDKEGIHDISGLSRIRNDRRDDLNDKKTGLVATIIQNAMSLMDSNGPDSVVVNS